MIPFTDDFRAPAYLSLPLILRVPKMSKATSASIRLIQPVCDQKKERLSTTLGNEPAHLEHAHYSSILQLSSKETSCGTSVTQVLLSTHNSSEKRRGRGERKGSQTYKAKAETSL